jgi:putative heme-binding domain-containing protein
MLLVPLPALLALLLLGEFDGPTLTLEEQLMREGAPALARAAASQGDARRGAIVFYQPHLLCASCHVKGERGEGLGPELATVEKTVSDSDLVEAILEPSKKIREGYQTVTVVTRDGKTTAGRLIEDAPDVVVIREGTPEGKAVRIVRAEIEERHDKGPSLMPKGLVNQLGSRQEFLDLVRYLTEVAHGGPTRALALRPDPALFGPAALPEYEKDLDHAGIIASLDSDSFQRGAQIYDRVCANCHGTKDRAGSLPTSLRFGSGAFKNGSDPYAMYQTITKGFGQMAPQAWMVPAQKYDVIHYIREAYLKRSNPTQYNRVDSRYLSALPKGKTRGPTPSEIEPWVAMDYGPSLMGAIESGEDGTNIAYKGIAVRLDPGPGGVSRGRTWALYEHDTLRLAAAWTGESFIDWEGINFNGKHQVHPRVTGDVLVANPSGPGWGDPETGSFGDPRARGRDGRAYGPLPRTWLHYRGVYHNGSRVILSYTVGSSPVLEMAGLESRSAKPVVTRTFELGPRSGELVLQVAHVQGERTNGAHAGRTPQAVLVPKSGGSGEAAVLSSGESGRSLVVGLSSAATGFAWDATAPGNLRLRVPKGEDGLRFALRIASVEKGPNLLEEARAIASVVAPEDLESFAHGGSARWPQVLTTQAKFGDDKGPFAVDVLTHPESNPWLCQMRFTGLDFRPGGEEAVLCTWDGDVWQVNGITGTSGLLTWRRIASGLFQPLGIKVVGGQVYVSCRDQIVILRDLNGDGETDFYESFNSDHQVTEHFHEFAMGLQTDADGNFYYAKAARHALEAVVPHHGTLLRVSSDGSRTDIIATGFRAPNGVCVNPDGTFFLTDQEGFWLPKNRINWVKPGSFHGNMWGYHNVTDTSDGAMEPPICWITNSFDRSPGQIVRVEGEGWGPLKGSLLNLSYGYGKIYSVLCERVGDKMQGGLATLPIPQFPTGVMRGRFHPGDGQLYACGMFAWAGNQTQPGGFYRVRYTGRPIHVPIGLRVRRDGIAITFSGALDRKAATLASGYSVRVWGLKRTENYGSDHINERALAVSAATLSEDGRTVLLALPKLAPTWCMAIEYAIRAADGSVIAGEIDNTIHELGDAGTGQSGDSR